VGSTSPLQAMAILPLDDFHKVSRAAGPKGQGKTTTPNYSLNPCTLRIRQGNGLDFSTVGVDLAAPSRCDLTFK
jgi:hypothetical protein